MYLNTNRWAIDIMLSLGFIFILTMFLLIRFVLLERKLTEYKLRLLIQDEINEINKVGKNLR